MKFITSVIFAFNKNILTQAEIYPKVYLYKRIVQSKLFIDENYADNIDLDNIADEAYFSKFHFIRLFKKIYGMTPYQYLQLVRIENAALLLRMGLAVTDVCLAVGFESLSSFSGLFKHMTGMPPSAFLAQQQRIKAEIQKYPLQFIPGCFAAKKGWIKKSNFEEMPG